MPSSIHQHLTLKHDINIVIVLNTNVPKEYICHGVLQPTVCGWESRICLKRVFGCTAAGERTWPTPSGAQTNRTTIMEWRIVQPWTSPLNCGTTHTVVPDSFSSVKSSRSLKLFRCFPITEFSHSTCRQEHSSRSENCKHLTKPQRGTQHLMNL